MWQCSTLIFKYSCGSSVLDVVESREMTEQTDWWAKQTIRSGLHLRRSDEVLRSLWQYLWAQDQGHPIIICLERSVEKRQRSTTYLERMRQGYCQSEQHWNCFKSNTGETSERWGGVHMWPSRPKWVKVLLGHFWGTANFPKGMPYYRFWLFKEISFSSLFYIRKYTSYMHRKFISVISKCLKQATLH